MTKSMMANVSCWLPLPRQGGQLQSPKSPCHNEAGKTTPAIHKAKPSLPSSGASAIFAEQEPIDANCCYPTLEIVRKLFSFWVKW